MIFTVGRTYNRLFLVLPEEIGRVNIGHQPQDFAGDPKSNLLIINLILKLLAALMRQAVLVIDR